MKTAIWWIRRDLRLSDNQALAEALNQASTVIPVFVLDPALLASDFVGPVRLAFLFDGLRALDTSLVERGSRLILRQGEPLEVLSALCRENQVDGIFAEEDYSPYAIQRDEKIALTLPLQLVNGATVFHPQMLIKANGEPYTVFTPFSRLWRSLPTAASPLPAPEYLPTVLTYKPRDPNAAMPPNREYFQSG